MNVPTTLKRNFIDSDVNNLTDSLNILDCKDGDSYALIGYPNLTGLYSTVFKLELSEWP